MMMTAVGRLFDQYSVICVFGSVVGCVVVPLITQSMETLIFSAIVMTLTAKTLGQRILALRQDTPTRDDARRNKDKDPAHEKKTKRKKIAQTQPPLSTDLQRRRLEDIKKQEELRQAEKERRMEEKKEKRARKKEERSKRKEEEKREREREEQLRRERQEQRAQKKQERERKTFSVHFPIVESLSQIESLSHHRPIQHERKHSSSSSTSTSSTRSHSHPHRGRHSHRQPMRASSDPLFPSPPSPTYHNSHPSPAPSPPPTARAWMTPSLPQAPLSWLSPTDSNQPMQRVNSDSSPCANPHLQHQQQQLIGHAMQYPNPTWFAQAPPGMFWPRGTALVHPELVESRRQVAWVPAAMATTPLDMLRYASMNSVLNTINGGDPSSVYAGDFPQEGYYSLFSNSGQSPFGTALLSSNTNNSDPDPSPSSNADLEPEPEPDPKGTDPVKPDSPPRRECDDWPSL